MNIFNDIPSNKGITRAIELETLYHKNTSKIDFKKDKKRILSFIEESFENHSKKTFWFSYNIAVEIGCIIEDDYPKLFLEIKKQYWYLCRIQNTYLVPKKKENIKSAIASIVTFYYKKIA